MVSALDVYNGSVNPNRFKGKIVLIGATADILRDNLDTPVDKSGGMPGVFIRERDQHDAHGVVPRRKFQRHDGDVGDGAFAAVGALAVLFLPLWLSIVVTFVLSIAYLLLTALQFDNGHIMNSCTRSSRSASRSSHDGALLHRGAAPPARLEAVRAVRTRDGCATARGRGPLEQAAEGERLDVSLFFCDLRGFTAMSANLTPQQVRIMLNEFYDALTQIILEYKGTVLKFVGDEVFAVFGAPWRSTTTRRSRSTARWPSARRPRVERATGRDGDPGSALRHRDEFG